MPTKYILTKYFFLYSLMRINKSEGIEM